MRCEATRKEAHRSPAPSTSAPTKYRLPAVARKRGARLTGINRSANIKIWREVDFPSGSTTGSCPATWARATLHLVSARDYLGFRAALQPGIGGAAEAVLKDRVEGVDLPAVLAAAEEIFGDRAFSDRRHLSAVNSINIARVQVSRCVFSRVG